MISPEILHVCAIVCRIRINLSTSAPFEELTGAQFHGPSSPQLHIAYTIPFPVDWSAFDIFA